MMRKRLSAIALSLALVLGLSPSLAFAAGTESAGLVAAQAVMETDGVAIQADGELDFAQPVDKTYSFTNDGGYINWKMSKAGIAHVNIKIEGVSKISISTWYARGRNMTASDLGAAYSGSVSEAGRGFTLRCSGNATEGEIDIMKDSADKGSDTKVTVHVTSEFKAATTIAKAVKAGKSVDITQAAGDLYWPVTLKKASRLVLNVKSGLAQEDDDKDYGGIGLCGLNKKAIEYEIDSTGKYAYVLPKGKYYVRTRVGSKMRADEFSFSYTAKSLGNYAASKNVSRSKATTIKLGKKASGFIAMSNPKFKAHFYKLKLNSAKTISVTWKNAKGVRTDLSILNKKGKKLYNSSNAGMNKGKDEFFLNKSGSKVSENVTLSKGTYYFKVERLSSYGAYSFKVK